MQEHQPPEVSKLLASTLDYQETLATIAHLADWFAVDLVNTAGQFELVEVDHADPEKVRWAKALREQFPVDPTAPGGPAHVFRTGQAVCYPHITDEMLAGTARSEEELALLRQVGSTSAMIVPLVARGKPIGVITFVASESGRCYDERDLALAEEVGRRAGLALDNARLYRAVRQARDQLDIILQGVADGIIVYDRSSQIIYANEAAAQITGFASVQAMLETPPLGIVSKYEIIDEQGRPFPLVRLTHRRVLAGEHVAQDIIGYCHKATGRPERWPQVTTQRGEDVEKLHEGSLPDLIILDVLLSGKDGRELVKHLKRQEETKHIPVMMLSAHPSAKESVREAGASKAI